MFEKFLSNYVSDSPVDYNDVKLCAEANGALKMLSGKTFDNGIYRILTDSQKREIDAQIELAFPEFSGRISSFAADWLGRIFAEDSQRFENGGKGIVMFEPGTAQALEIPCDIELFHDDELINYREEALASSFYEEWLKSGGVAPNSLECIGYDVPLYLNGADGIGNLRLSNLEVYWHLSSQLIRRAKGLPAGTAIGNIDIS